MRGSPIVLFKLLNLVYSSVEHTDLHKCNNVIYNNYNCVLLKFRTSDPLVSREKLGLTDVLNENKLV